MDRLLASTSFERAVIDIFFSLAVKLRRSRAIQPCMIVLAKVMLKLRISKY